LDDLLIYKQNTYCSVCFRPILHNIFVSRCWLLYLEQKRITTGTLQQKVNQYNLKPIGYLPSYGAK